MENLEAYPASSYGDEDYYRGIENTNREGGTNGFKAYTECTDCTKKALSDKGRAGQPAETPRNFSAGWQWL